MLFVCVYTFFHFSTWHLFVVSPRLKDGIPDGHATWLYIFRAALLVHSTPQTKSSGHIILPFVAAKNIRNVCVFFFRLYIVTHTDCTECALGFVFFSPCNITGCTIRLNWKTL